MMSSSSSSNAWLLLCLSVRKVCTDQPVCSFALSASCRSLGQTHWSVPLPNMASVIPSSMAPGILLILQLPGGISQLRFFGLSQETVEKRKGEK
uniref:Secreted protein n=1 Tax=Anguilla anguilla TaxID=7936 RepID=A0A0E9VS39_ANGAN